MTFDGSWSGLIVQCGDCQPHRRKVGALLVSLLCYSGVGLERSRLDRPRLNFTPASSHLPLHHPKDHCLAGRCKSIPEAAISEGERDVSKCL